jgi:two-component system response regulator PrrA
MLSARDAVGDRVAGLHAGADDYLVKPFDLDELVARLGALMRRASARTPAPRTVSVGSLRLDLDRRVAHVDGTAVDLTRREFDLLVALAEHRHVVLSRVQLLELVWGYDFDVETNVVDVFVGYVRRKLGAIAGAPTIRTVRGVGFVLESD